METIRVARQAMATRFEIVLHGSNAVSLRAAGEEALDEIDRIEDRLSIYRPSSEIARVNARAANEPVRVSPATFRLIEEAVRLGAETQGAFDVTVGPLVRCWGFMGASGKLPTAEAIAEARARVGMNLLELDPVQFTIRFAREGVMLDLGAIGKGHAVGVAGDILREAGVTSALVHGGTSSVFALGHPPDADVWKVAIDRPGAPVSDPAVIDESRVGERCSAIPAGARPQASAQPPPEILAVVCLCDEALSVSAVWGKSFQSGDQSFGHVIDPRTGAPSASAVLSAVALPSATETDALSTALLTLGPPGLELLTAIRPSARLLVAGIREDKCVVSSRGIETCFRDSSRHGKRS